MSNPSNQDSFETAPKLLRYLIKHQHWSPFEHAHMTVEIETSCAIATQILRHRSFVYQQFSQRYAEALDYESYPARRQDTKNRQNSVDDLDESVKYWFEDKQAELWILANEAYQTALKMGIAKEQARFLLPLNTQTTMYMTGNVRCWLHYIELRSANGTQKEHRDIALAIKDIFAEEFPDVHAAMEEMKAAIEIEKRKNSRMHKAYEAVLDYFRMDSDDFLGKHGLVLGAVPPESPAAVAENYVKALIGDL